MHMKEPVSVVQNVGNHRLVKHRPWHGSRSIFSGLLSTGGRGLGARSVLTPSHSSHGLQGQLSEGERTRWGGQRGSFQQHVPPAPVPPCPLPRGLSLSNQRSCLVQAPGTYQECTSGKLGSSLAPTLPIKG